MSKSKKQLKSRKNRKSQKKSRTPTKESPKMTVSKEQLKIIFDQKMETNIMKVKN